MNIYVVAMEMISLILKSSNIVLNFIKIISILFYYNESGFWKTPVMKLVSFCLVLPQISLGRSPVFKDHNLKADCVVSSYDMFPFIGVRSGILQKCNYQMHSSALLFLE
jgi:hypothetical protein